MMDTFERLRDRYYEALGNMAIAYEALQDEIKDVAKAKKDFDEYLENCEAPK
jgi:hypothetical protein